MCKKLIVMLQCCLVIFSLFITVSSPQLTGQNDLNTNDDRWVWGYADVSVPSRNSNYTEAPTIPPIIKDEDLPEICLPYNPPKPDFSAPGKRISEAKCDEYVWQLKIRQKNNDRSKECQEELDRLYPNRLRPAGAIGGRDTVLGEFPHMGAIGWLAFATTYVFKCGSSLISSRFVLTAAHCSRASDRDSTITDPVPKVVRLGDKNIINSFSGGLLITDDKIVSIIVHPQYAPPKKYYDIALMKLENEVHFTKYTQPACMWTKFDTSSLGPTATLTGWGVVETHGKTTSPELQAAVVDLIDSDTCNQLLKSSCNRNWCGVRDDQLCAGKLAGGVDACQGDSGGPLQVQLPIHLEAGTMHYVIGVTSFGIGCALPNLPGIYTRVSSYLDWIEPIVWPDS